MNATDHLDHRLDNHLDNPALEQKARLGRWATLLCLALLLASFTGFALTQARGSLTLWLLQSGPLLAFLPGLLASAARPWRSYSWLCFLVLFYFIVAATNLLSPLATFFDWLELAASVGLFLAAMLTSRWLQRLHWPAPTHSTAVENPGPKD